MPSRCLRRPLRWLAVLALALCSWAPAHAARLPHVTAAAATEPRPVWHRAFRIDFNETTRLLWSWQTAGVLFYDADAGAELVYRENG